MFTFAPILLVCEEGDKSFSPIDRELLSLKLFLSTEEKLDAIGLEMVGNIL